MLCNWSHYIIARSVRRHTQSSSVLCFFLLISLKLGHQTTLSFGLDKPERPVLLQTSQTQTEELQDDVEAEEEIFEEPEEEPDDKEKDPDYQPEDEIEDKVAEEIKQWSSHQWWLIEMHPPCVATNWFVKWYTD